MNELELVVNHQRSEDAIGKSGRIRLLLFGSLVQFLFSLEERRQKLFHF